MTIQEEPNGPSDLAAQPSAAPGQQAAPAARSAARPQLGVLGNALNVLKIRDFRYLLVGNIMLSAGFQVRQMAYAWLVLDQTNSSLKAGIVNGMPGISVLISLFGGTVSDRLDRRALIVWARLSIAAFMLAAALLVATGIVQWWHLIPIGLALGVTFAFLEPAGQSYAMDVVGRDRLLNATSVGTAISNLANIAAPALGGAALALGINWAFWLLAAFYGVSFLSILPVRTKNKSAPSAHSILSEMRAGLRYAAGSAAIKWILILSSGFLFNGIAMAIFPIFARNIFQVGAVGYGTMLTVQGVGALVGSIALVLAGDVKRKGLLIFANMVLSGVFLVVFAVSPWYSMGLGALFVFGLTQGVTYITVPTTIQRLSAPEMRGRVMGIYVMVVTVFQPAWIVGGALNSVIGTRQTALVAGAGVLGLAFLAFARSKALRDVT